MRMRKKKNLDVRFAACADVMAFEPKEKRGKWRALLQADSYAIARARPFCHRHG